MRRPFVCSRRAVDWRRVGLTAPLRACVAEVRKCDSRTGQDGVLGADMTFRGCAESGESGWTASRVL